ncbi:hypothetical protein HD554DRAFT_2039354 [Boletus coccyginus]|nr:hypothetical protein HD554DRAFT_2039354 [Boletus coccyginus]
MAPSSHELKTDSFTTTISTTAATTPVTTPATSHHQHEHNDIPDHLSTKPPVLTNDFYRDTFFNPVWMSGPHVFSFAEDGTVVRPKTYALEPYPGYHADCLRRLDSVDATHLQGCSKGDPKPWKNVAITEQDDAEFAAFQERMRTATLAGHSAHTGSVHAVICAYHLVGSS